MRVLFWGVAGGSAVLWGFGRRVRGCARSVWVAVLVAVGVGWGSEAWGVGPPGAAGVCWGRVGFTGGAVL